MTTRLALSLTALVLSVVAFAGLALAIFTTVSLSIVVVWVGLPGFIGSVACSRAFADAHRTVAGRVLGRELVQPYRASAGQEWFARMRWLLTDPATWRDMLWLLVNCTAGVTLTMLTSFLLLGSAFCLCYPLLLALTSPGMFDAPFGLFTLHRPVDGFGLWIVGAVAFWLWWQFTPWLMRGWALMSAALLEPTRKAVLEGRVAALAASRADTVDSAAAEIRRIERDLHDGAQARLVALSMSLGLADELVADDPDRARVLLAEARQTTATVLQELRDLVRGIHPPVLADRGLVKAVRAMALDSPLPVGVRTTGFGDAEELRLPEPVEACAYFVVSEAMANIGKHARARRVEIRLELVDQTLYASIGDDGRGGARLNAGSGLTGLARRLAAFDGTLTVTSPPGGPTILTMELPCAPQSLKITPSSAKG